VVITHNRGTIEAGRRALRRDGRRRFGEPGDQPPARRGAAIADRQRGSGSRPRTGTARAGKARSTSSPRSADVLASQAGRGARRAGIGRIRPAARRRAHHDRRRGPGGLELDAARRRHRRAEPAPSPSPLARAAAFKPLFADTRRGDRGRLEQGSSAPAAASCPAPRRAGRRAGRPSWDDVEETLIAGDVGRGARDGRRRGRQARRDPAAPRPAIRAELAGMLVPRDAPLGAASGGRRRPASSSSSASTAPARRRRSASSPRATRRGRTCSSPPPTRSRCLRSTSS
jgi:hypothetical protein